MCKRMSYVAMLLMVFAVVNVACAGACIATSGAIRAELIELYTSEGCSSCPAADRWLSGLLSEGTENVVALAFHVDYWDRLGWRDRFSAPVHSARQYAYAKGTGRGFVYTPQIIIAGRNDVQWFNAERARQALRKVRNNVPDARIVLRQQPAVAGSLPFSVKAQLRKGVLPGDVYLYAALIENGLESAVDSGENSGKRLHHDFVVRSLLISDAVDTGGKIEFNSRFAVPRDARLMSMYMAVFAQHITSGEVLQAMTVPACMADQ